MSERTLKRARSNLLAALHEIDAAMNDCGDLTFAQMEAKDAIAALEEAGGNLLQLEEVRERGRQLNNEKHPENPIPQPEGQILRF